MFSSFLGKRGRTRRAVRARRAREISSVAKGGVVKKADAAKEKRSIERESKSRSEIQRTAI